MGAITQIDSDTGTTYDLSSIQTVYSGIVDSNDHRRVQVLIELGNGSNDLDGTGGAFEVTIISGGQTLNGGIIYNILGTEVRASIETMAFTVRSGDTLTIKLKSPNAGDTTVAVDVYVMDTTLETPSNFDLMSIDSNGYVALDADQSSVTIGYVSYGVTVDTNNDKSDYQLASSPVPEVNLIQVAGASFNDGTIDANFVNFWANNTSSTTKVVDDVGGGGAGSWTSTDVEQARYRLGIDGTTSTPSASENLTVNLDTDQSSVTIGYVMNGVTVDTNNDKTDYELSSTGESSLIEAFLNTDANTYTSADTIGCRVGPDIDAIRSDASSLDNTKLPDVLSLAAIKTEILEIFDTDDHVDGLTAFQAFRCMAAMLYGRISNAGTIGETFNTADNANARVAFTVDTTSGDRDGVTLTPDAGL